MLTLDVNLRLVITIFDRQGQYINEDSLDLAGKWPIPDHGYPEVNHDELREFLRAELGFESGLIQIKEFLSDRVSVVPFPWHYQEFLDNPSSKHFQEEDRENYPRYIQEWVNNAEFVLHWGNDYWLNKNGEVTSS